MDSTEALSIPGAASSASARALQETEFELPSRPSQVSHVRDRVRKVARSMQFTPDQIDDICIAVGEAATNAVKHGRNPLYPRIGVRIERFPRCPQGLHHRQRPGLRPMPGMPARASAISANAAGESCACGR